MVKAFVKKIFYFYYDGFRSMTVGKKLWMIILIKLFIMFAILKLFFFRDFLGSKFETDKERSEYILDQLTR
jgi:hypothetical protein